MVDTTVSFGGIGLATILKAQPAVPETTITVATGEAALAYAEFCRSALSAPAQSAAWVRNWIAHINPDAVIAMAAVEGRTVFSLALEVVAVGRFRVARFMGGRHANGNFAATDPAWLGAANVAVIQALLRAIAKARPDIDLVALERLMPDLDGVANPLAALPNFPSPNLSLAVDLKGGFDAVLDRATGKRRRKKHRSQARKFEAFGTLRRIEARTPQEARVLLDAFFTMKEIRFATMGIFNVFGEPRVQAFFHALFADALREDKPSFVLHGLEAVGKLRAVTGSSLSGKRLICEFGSIADDELGHISPGDFLAFENIEEACTMGFDVYDFSVGDEPYKRMWCDIETQHFEVLSPLTLKGRALAFGLRQGTRLKASIKHNPTVWKLTRMLRRKTAKQAASSVEDDNPV